MKFGLWGLVLCSFLAGLLTAHLLENPQFPSATVAAERASPQDWISERDIKVYPDRVIIEVEGAKWAKFADTKSMDPFLDVGANAIQLVPKNPEDLQIGDIITYDYHGMKIIHRIVDIGHDQFGIYYIVKGDNNPRPDDVRVRFEDVERVLIAVIY